MSLHFREQDDLTWVYVCLWVPREEHPEPGWTYGELHPLCVSSLITGFCEITQLWQTHHLLPSYSFPLFSSCEGFSSHSPGRSLEICSLASSCNWPVTLCPFAPKASSSFVWLCELLCSYVLPFVMTPLFGLLSSFIRHIVVDFYITCPSHIRCPVTHNSWNSHIGTFGSSTLDSVVPFHLCCMVDWSLLWPVIQTDDNSWYDTSIWFHISSTERRGWPWHWIGMHACELAEAKLHSRDVKKICIIRYKLKINKIITFCNAYQIIKLDLALIQ